MNAKRCGMLALCGVCRFGFEWNVLGWGQALERRHMLNGAAGGYGTAVFVFGRARVPLGFNATGGQNISIQLFRVSFGT